jgi:hypothetical protein
LPVEGREASDMRLKWVVVLVALCVIVTVAAVAYAAGKATADVPEVIRAHRFELLDNEGKVRAVLALTPDMGAVLKLDGYVHRGRRTWLSGEVGVQLYDESGNKRADLGHMGLRVVDPVQARAAAQEAWEALVAAHGDVPDTLFDGLRRVYERQYDPWIELGFFHGPHLGPVVALSDRSATDGGQLWLAVDDAGVPLIEFVDAAQDPPKVLTVSMSEEGRLTVYGAPPQQTDEEGGEDTSAADDRADEEATPHAGTEDGESAEE